PVIAPLAAEHRKTRARAMSSGPVVEDSGVVKPHEVHDSEIRIWCPRTLRRIQGWLMRPGLPSETISFTRDT
ncbi:hypothetical protein, partial [Streptomyces asiaticus]